MEYLQQQLAQIEKIAAGPNTTITSNTTSSYGLTPGDIKSTETTSTSVSNYTEPILYVRSRNIEFDSHSLKPTTRFYPFFSEIDISKYVVPKLLEVEMVSGVFQPGEIVESDSTFTTSKIVFRLCSLNHKTGVYDVPETTFPFNPYNQQPLGSDYSESSTILNVDTKALSLPSETDFYGSVGINMQLIGRTSGAIARVSNIRLISDRNGRLIGSFFVPNPAKFGNIKFINGVNVLTLVDVDNLNLLAEAESFSEADYSSTAINNVSEVNILTTRNVNITFPSLITKVGNNVKIASTVTKGSGEASQVEAQRETVLNTFTNTLGGQEPILLAPEQVNSLQTQSANITNTIASLEEEISNSTNTRRNTENTKKVGKLTLEKDRIDLAIRNSAGENRSREPGSSRSRASVVKPSNSDFIPTKPSRPSSTVIRR